MSDLWKCSGSHTYRSFYSCVLSLSRNICERYTWTTWLRKGAIAYYHRTSQSILKQSEMIVFPINFKTELDPLKFARYKLMAHSTVCRQLSFPYFLYGNDCPCLQLWTIAFIMHKCNFQECPWLFVYINAIQLLWRVKCWNFNDIYQWLCWKTKIFYVFCLPVLIKFDPCGFVLSMSVAAPLMYRGAWFMHRPWHSPSAPCVLVPLCRWFETQTKIGPSTPPDVFSQREGSTTMIVP